MSAKKTPAVRHQVDEFLQQVAKTPASHQRGRLIFAMDATASRQPTWDQACQLQGDMFLKTRGLGDLSVQIAFFRGYGEFRISPWHSEPAQLVKTMQSVHCLGGHTQIRKVLTHAYDEHRRQPIQALVYIGDCVEEPVDALSQQAGKLGIMGVPLFIFQEGRDPNANFVFQQLARLSGGAHCQLDQGAASMLGDLLNAVAVFATGGHQALTDLSHSSQGARLLSHQVRKSKP